MKKLNQLTIVYNALKVKRTTPGSFCIDTNLTNLYGPFSFITHVLPPQLMSSVKFPPNLRHQKGRQETILTWTIPVSAIFKDELYTLIMNLNFSVMSLTELIHQKKKFRLMLVNKSFSPHFKHSFAPIT